MPYLYRDTAMGHWTTCVEMEYSHCRDYHGIYLTPDSGKLIGRGGLSAEYLDELSRYAPNFDAQKWAMNEWYRARNFPFMNISIETMRWRLYRYYAAKRGFEREELESLRRRYIDEKTRVMDRTVFSAYRHLVVNED